MKKIIKLIIFFVNSLLKRDISPKTLFYHDVSKRYTSMGTEKSIFWKQMNYLRSNDRICFDDGFQGIWDERNEFAKRNIKPIVFLAIELVGQEGYLTWDEIVILQNEFGFDFQSHTWSHQTLAGPYNKKVKIPAEGRTEDWFKHELFDSKQELETRLKKKITSLCFPVGYFSDDVVKRCKEAGYKEVYASYPGNISQDYVQPRCLCQDLSPLSIFFILRGGMNVLKARYLKVHKVDKF